MKKLLFLLLCFCQMHADELIDRLCDFSAVSTLKELKQLSREFEGKYPFSKSDTPLDILIPTIERDLSVAEQAVKCARKNVKHPIQNIYIVAPATEKVKRFCEENNCVFVDESQVLPIQKRDIKYVWKGLDRKGWLFQQLLKLSADSICQSEHILILDSDTLIIRPQVFTFDDHVIFNCSNEHHEPYFKTYKTLLKEKASARFSFISHHMLFQKSVLKELKKSIEINTNMNWVNAIISIIDENEVSCFSEYETYGNYFISHYPQKALQLYFFNSRFNRNLFPHPSEELPPFTKSITFEIWF